ncbi:MAG TPA: N-acetyl-gamma-glutamyl-phosphate reductase [Acidimicrobiia bacterium]|nr:N-acetyl-gamma-glutamyl-phosphate reductase [Acidimicrobiia bacterium]
MSSYSVAVLGASGYAGGELVRLLDSHPDLDVVHLGAHSKEGASLADVHPHLAGGERPLGSNEIADLGGIDVAFLALPHGASAEVGVALRRRGVLVVDLGSDFRLDTEARYREAYGSAHPFPDQLSDWVYGLPELFDVTGSTAIASPGCYPTAVILALAPLLAAGLMATEHLVADCLSGVSGAGRGVTAELAFGAVDEGVRAYAVGSHRHRPEIEMALDALGDGTHRIVFTPHLVPMQRGILATVTGQGSASAETLRDCLRDAYAKAAFVDVIDRPPQTRWVVSSNRALVTAFADEHTGSVIAQCAIDNLGKGAAGQAVQAANLALGLPETSGLPMSGWMP